MELVHGHIDKNTGFMGISSPTLFSNPIDRSPSDYLRQCVSQHNAIFVEIFDNPLLEGALNVVSIYS